MLAENEELLQPGRNLVCHVQAEVTEEQTRLTLRAVQPVEQVAEDAAAVGLEVHVSDAAASSRSATGWSWSRRRRGAGAARGRSSWSSPLAELGPEVEIDLPGQYAVSIEIRGALKSAPGVQEVRTF